MVREWYGVLYHNCAPIHASRGDSLNNVTNSGGTAQRPNNVALPAAGGMAAAAQSSGRDGIGGVIGSRQRVSSKCHIVQGSIQINSLDSVQVAGLGRLGTDPVFSRSDCYGVRGSSQIVLRA